MYMLVTIGNLYSTNHFLHESCQLMLNMHFFKYTYSNYITRIIPKYQTVL